MAKRHLIKWHVIYKKNKKRSKSKWTGWLTPPPPSITPPPPRASLLCVNESNWPSCAIGKVRTCRSHFSMCVLTWIMTSHLKLPPPPPPTPQPLKGATPLSKIQQTKKGRLAGLHLTVVFLLWMGLPFVRKKWGLKRFLNN